MRFACCARGGPPRPGPCSAPVWLSAPILSGFICCEASLKQELQAWDAADSDFQKASQMPLDDNARYVLFVNRGVLRVRQERFEDAVADLKSAIERKPKAYQAYVNLAQAYRRLNKLDLALEQLNRAVQLEPGLAHLYRLRARLYLERNEPALALADFDQAIERENTNSPYQVDDHVERGRLLLVGGKHAEGARARSTLALALQKDHSLAQRLRAETLFRLGRFEEVIKAFDRYLETGKPLESVYRGRGLARAELGQYPGAIEDFTKALELHPTSAVQAYRGWTHLVVDAPKLALRDFELAIELDSKNGDAYNGRGFARASLGRHREAIQDAAEALRFGPSSPRLLYNAARIYAQCPGPCPQRALELIQQALSLLPADERRAFWSTHIRTDAAMAALRRYPLFVRLDAELSHGEVIHACSRTSRWLARPTASPVVVLAAGRRLARTPHPACHLAPGSGCPSALRRVQRCSSVALPLHSRRGRSLLRRRCKKARRSTPASTPSRPAARLTSLLRIFDASGTPLALDDQQGGDPQLSFQAATAGIYYVGVSSAPNNNYNPTVVYGGVPGATTGLYTLDVTLTTSAPLLPDLTGSSFRTGVDMAAAGDTIPVNFTVQNRGGADPGNFQVQVLLADSNRLRQLLASCWRRSRGRSWWPDATGRDFSSPAGFSVTLPRGLAVGPACHRPAYRGRPGGARSWRVRQERRPSRLGLGAAHGRHTRSRGRHRPVAGR